MAVGDLVPKAVSRFARYLGYDAQMYDGSFVDWSPREELPVTRGPAAGI